MKINLNLVANVTLTLCVNAARSVDYPKVLCCSIDPEYSTDECEVSKAPMSQMFPHTYGHITLLFITSK